MIKANPTTSTIAIHWHLRVLKLGPPQTIRARLMAIKIILYIRVEIVCIVMRILSLVVIRVGSLAIIQVVIVGHLLIC